jgi:RNA polymerase sigma factor (sigma-70 family)
VSDIACNAVEKGEWEPHLALSGLSDFLDELCLEDSEMARMPLADYWNLAEAMKKEIEKSKQWDSYVERLAKLSEGIKEPSLTQEAIVKPELLDHHESAKLMIAKSAKKHDLSNYFDAANLTERQHQCASLRWEYELPVAAIARQLNLSRPTVDQHLDSARKKMDKSGQYEKMKKNLAKTNADNQWN